MVSQPGQWLSSLKGEVMNVTKNLSEHMLMSSHLCLYIRGMVKKSLIVFHQ